MNELLSPRYTACREKHPPLRFLVRARRRGADDDDRTLKEIVSRHRTVRPVERIRSASTLRANARTRRDSVTPVRAQGCKGGTFPRNRLLGPEERGAKRLA